MKINLNAGDALFYPDFTPSNYRGDLDGWNLYIRAFYKKHDVQCVCLFGDCRPHHAVAIRIARAKNIPVYVFEEGYLRPHFITCEKWGTNGYSALPQKPEFYRALGKQTPSPAVNVRANFARMAGSAFLYHLTEKLFEWAFPHYEYHKSYSVRHEIKSLFRSVYRKALYKVTESEVCNDLKGHLSGKYFLVPLQVYNDSQVEFHSKHGCVTAFIRETLQSFAQNEDSSLHLVFKHHPVDRGHKHYGAVIAKLATSLGIEGRVHYVHDLHLPTLIRHARGVLVINSTAGFSALHHNIPVKTMGTAVYDMPGLTHQGSLSDFWRNPGGIDKALYLAFKGYVRSVTQENGCFYGGRPPWATYKPLRESFGALFTQKKLQGINNSSI